jgi:hypothetical protein
MLRLRKRMFFVLLVVISPVIAIIVGGGVASASTTSTQVVVSSQSSSADPSTGATHTVQTGVESSAAVPASVLQAAQAANASSPLAVSCQTIYASDTDSDVLGITLAKFQMNTYYCWNDEIVTYHQTWQTNSTNLGWSYKGLLDNTFFCYYANSNSCSGNYEQMQGNFSGPLSQNFQPTCWLEEVYTGGFSGNCSG